MDNVIDFFFLITLGMLGNALNFKSYQIHEGLSQDQALRLFHTKNMNALSRHERDELRYHRNLSIHLLDWFVASFDIKDADDATLPASLGQIFFSNIGA